MMETNEFYKEIADWITEYGLNGTTTGNYIIYYDTIAKAFCVPEEWVREHAGDIEYCLDFDIVAECYIDGTCFDMMFYLQYCCEHCAQYMIGKRCYEECSHCDCWCDSMDENYEYKEVEYKPYVKSQELIDSELKAKQCLKDRQNELNTLKFRHFECNLWREQKELLREAGYFVYDLRDWDDGNGYNIELHVVVNHIGCWITDIDLRPYMNDESWIGIDELKFAQIEDIPYAEIMELLKKGEELHFKK